MFAASCGASATDVFAIAYSATLIVLVVLLLVARRRRRGR